MGGEGLMPMMGVIYVVFKLAGGHFGGGRTDGRGRTDADGRIYIINCINLGAKLRGRRGTGRAFSTGPLNRATRTFILKWASSYFTKFVRRRQKYLGTRLAVFTRPNPNVIDLTGGPRVVYPP
jgi:hypothetical protein